MDETDETPAPEKKIHFGLRPFFFGFTVIAILLGSTSMHHVASVWVVVLLITAFVMIDRRSRFRLAMVLIVVYSPYYWLLSLDYLQSQYHLSWLKMWPILPGLNLAAEFEHSGYQINWFEFQDPTISHRCAAAIITLLLIAAATAIAKIGPKTLVAILAIALLASVLNSLACRELFNL